MCDIAQHPLTHSRHLCFRQGVKVNTTPSAGFLCRRLPSRYRWRRRSVWTRTRRETLHELQRAARRSPSLILLIVTGAWLNWPHVYSIYARRNGPFATGCSNYIFDYSVDFTAGPWAKNLAAHLICGVKIAVTWWFSWQQENWEWLRKRSLSQLTSNTLSRKKRDKVSSYGGVKTIQGQINQYIIHLQSSLHHLSSVQMTEGCDLQYMYEPLSEQGVQKHTVALL